jgi:hypothetical protein
VRAFDRYALVVEIQITAAELCPLPEGTPVRPRFLRDGRLEIAQPLNLENLAAGPPAYVSGMRPEVSGSPTMRSSALRSLLSA